MQPIQYELKRSLRARALRIRVNTDGKVFVTIPYFSSVRRAEVFVEEKSDWIREKVEYFLANPTPKPLTRKRYKESKEDARKLVHERLTHFNQFYKFPYNRVSIKNSKTRWGSCSKQRNLNFNYKILFLPPELADYLIVHELCHLGQLNHSKAFWDLVAEMIPDYKKKRSELRKLRL